MCEQRAGAKRGTGTDGEWSILGVLACAAAYNRAGLTVPDRLVVISGRCTCRCG